MTTATDKTLVDFTRARLHSKSFRGRWGMPYSERGNLVDKYGEQAVDEIERYASRATVERIRAAADKVRSMAGRIAMHELTAILDAEAER